MPDSKYGRLYTEADVRRIVSTTMGVIGLALGEGEKPPMNGREMLDHVLAVTEPAHLAFLPDEPLFLLRGQDRYAPWGAQFYVDGLASHLADVGAGEANVSREHFDAAHKAWQAMLFWQRQHPDRVKVPD